MLVPLDTTHVEEALSQLLQQYQGQPRLESLLTALVNQIQDLEDASYPLNAGRQLAFAVGQQLDGLGEIIGLPRNGLDDDTYRIFLIGTIAKNFSDSTIKSITTILLLLLDPAFLLVFETFPAGVSVQFGGSTRDPSLYNLIAQLAQEALGATITLTFVSEIDPVNPFRFLKTPTQPGPQGGGFDDALNPGAGGKWAGVIFP